MLYQNRRVHIFANDKQFLIVVNVLRGNPYQNPQITVHLTLMIIIIIIIGIYIAPFPFIKCSKALHIVIV